jgi:hypothetical protein
MALIIIQADAISRRVGWRVQLTFVRFSCCFFNLPTIFGLGGVRCYLSPMRRPAEKRAP